MLLLLLLMLLLEPLWLIQLLFVFGQRMPLMRTCLRPHLELEIVLGVHALHSYVHVSVSLDGMSIWSEVGDGAIDAFVRRESPQIDIR